MTDDPDDPMKELVAAFREDVERRRELANAHARFRESSAYKEQIGRLRKTVRGMVLTLHLCDCASSRSSWFNKESLFRFYFDDLAEAAISAQVSIEHGALNPARRELRYMIEVAVNSLYADQASPAHDFESNVRFYNSKRVRKRNPDHIRDLELQMLGDARDSFTSATIDAWVKSTNYVHPTKQRMMEKIELRAGGFSLGLETIEMLKDAVDELHTACSIIVVLAFEAIGQAASGDLIVDGLDSDDTWPFHESPFVAAIDAHFDYKAERQGDIEAHTARRHRRLLGAE